MRFAKYVAGLLRVLTVLVSRLILNGLLSYNYRYVPVPKNFILEQHTTFPDADDILCLFQTILKKKNDPHIIPIFNNFSLHNGFQLIGVYKPFEWLPTF